jgi:hypothetical protein
MPDRFGRSPFLPILGFGVALILLAAGGFLLQRRNSAPEVNSNVPPEVTGTVTVPQRQDTDADGLSDAEEVALGTDPKQKDSDADGLTDYEEAKVYRTDPLKPDTDGDGHVDGEEVDGGFNPKGDGPLLPSANAIQNLNAQASTNASTTSNTNQP